MQMLFMEIATLEIARYMEIVECIYIYISGVRKLLYRSLTTIYPTVKLITQA